MKKIFDFWFIFNLCFLAFVIILIIALDKEKVGPIVLPILLIWGLINLFASFFKLIKKKDKNKLQKFNLILISTAILGALVFLFISFESTSNYLNNNVGIFLRRLSVILLAGSFLIFFAKETVLIIKTFFKK